MHKNSIGDAGINAPLENFGVGNQPIVANQPSIVK